MKFGLTQEEFTFILKTAVKPLEDMGAKIYCYGSRARGDYKKFSDLDLMVESNTDLNKQISQIKEDLEKSNFQYKVDLVEFKNFAESYKKTYQEDKVLFYKKEN